MVSSQPTRDALPTDRSGKRPQEGLDEGSASRIAAPGQCPLPGRPCRAQLTLSRGHSLGSVSKKRRATVRFGLTTYSYHLLEAATPDRAISVSEEFEGRIDLVLIDLVMPGMNGAELALLVKAQRPEVKLLYMSGYTEFARTLGSEVQARLLQKPFGPDTLLHRVRRVLDSGVC